MRRILMVGLSGLLFTAAANAATNPACWYRDIEQIDETMTPPEQGDNAFFTGSAVSPNLIWLLDNSGSMQTLPCNGDCNSYTACGDASSGLNNYGQTYFTDMGYLGYLDAVNALPQSGVRAYPGYDTDFCSPTGSTTGYSGNDGCYKPGIVYKSTNSGACTSWPSSGGVWVIANSTEAQSNFTEYCRLKYTPTTPSSSTGSACPNVTTSCPTGYTCQNITYHGNDGNSCTGWPARGNCSLGQLCSSSTHKCTATTSCTSNADCFTGYGCDTSTGKCGQAGQCKLPTGATACSTTSGYTCPDGYVCDATSGLNKCLTDSTATTQCINSLKNQGYDPGGKGANVYFSGDLLNFYPPKFVTARKVLKDTALAVKQTRQGLFTFDNQDTQGGELVRALGPTCDKFLNGSGQPIMPADSVFTTAAQSVTAGLNGMQFKGGTPLAGSLNTVLQYYSGKKTNYETKVKVHGTAGAIGSFSSDGQVSDTAGTTSDSICYSCQKNFVAIITDGSPSGDSAVPCALKNYDQDCREKLQNSPSCSSSSSCGTAVGSYDFLDDVAGFGYAEDLRVDANMPGQQNVITDTIGFVQPGTTNSYAVQLLQRTAAEGNGVAFVGTNEQQLRDALAAIVQDVNTRGTSFSAASVTTVQTKGTAWAFIPRFQPSNATLWVGHLFRFDLFNEFAQGCSSKDTTPIPPATTLNADQLSRNPNGDSSCSDVYVMDQNGKIVQEDSSGNYLVADTTKTWNSSTGWPLTNPPTSATPFWDAQKQLTSRDLTTPGNNPRKIYTVVDSDGDGVLEPTEMIQFNTTNVSQLVTAMALQGATGTYCTNLSIAQNKSAYTTETACATDLIKYVTGWDLMDENKNGSTTDVRPSVLGDIFHSAPILVTPPVSQYLCDLGVAGQCSSSLYNANLTPNGAAAYNTWSTAQAHRQQFILVGANDGMLHAFNAGIWKSGDNAATPYVETDGYFDNGTGQELWAFIPPDVLPKLKRMIPGTARHELYVDGTPMVRDVWVDSTTNARQKDSGEFHTIAITGERQGGRNYFALDVTDPATPSFLWMYPQVGTTHALQMGQSWEDFAPGPPPIGPVAVEDSIGKISVNGTKANEVWAVFLNGGYDSNLVRGRSVNILNAWTGAEMWRFSAEDATGTSDVRSNLMPVAAPVTILDLGNASTLSGQQDGLFDTAIVGDTLGQVWTFRFWVPGKDTTSDGLFDNWYGARSFSEFKGSAISQRSPFFQMVEVAADPTTGLLRAFAGSGDRANIRDLNGGECDTVNLQACLKKGCSLNVNPATNQQGASSTLKKYDGVVNVGAGASTFTTNTISKDTNSTQNACSDATTQAITAAVSCNSGAISQTWNWNLTCNWSSTTAPCSSMNERPQPLYNTIGYEPTNTKDARFYGFNLYGTGRTPFNTSSEAASYDTASLTDTDLTNVSPGNVSAGTNGWFIDYNKVVSGTDQGQNERTSNSAVILGGCVQWDTLTPSGTPAVCGGQVDDVARHYHADFLTGKPACGAITSTERYSTSTAIVPPPTATPVVSVNMLTGQVQYSTVNVQAGQPPTSIAVGQGDVAGPVFWLEVPREVHDCRHGTGTCTVPP